MCQTWRLLLQAERTVATGAADLANGVAKDVRELEGDGVKVTEAKNMLERSLPQPQAQ